MTNLEKAIATQISNSFVNEYIDFLTQELHYPYTNEQLVREWYDLVTEWIYTEGPFPLLTYNESIGQRASDRIIFAVRDSLEAYYEAYTELV